MNSARADATATPADRVVVSYPADLSTWGRSILERRSFRAYLRKTLGTVAADDVTEEFVGVGCCGDTLDVPLRIESVTGGDTVTADTTVEYTDREACGVAGGWRVQSESGP